MFFLRISDILLLISVLTVMSLQGKGDCQALDIMWVFFFSENNLFVKRKESLKTFMFKRLKIHLFFTELKM